jgi:hypothetical protein
MTREGVAIDFPTRARGAAAISRMYGEEPDPDDAKVRKPVPMTIEFACHARCLDGLWPRLGEPVDNRTLNELDGAWPAPDFDSHVVRESHRLRSVPIPDMSTEDLRLLIGQGIGLPWLVPVALTILRADPMAAGDFYPGDLLASVLRVGVEYWQSHPDDQAALDEVRRSLPPGSDGFVGSG